MQAHAVKMLRMHISTLKQRDAAKRQTTLANDVHLDFEAATRKSRIRDELTHEGGAGLARVLVQHTYYDVDAFIKAELPAASAVHLHVAQEMLLSNEGSLVARTASVISQYHACRDKCVSDGHDTKMLEDTLRMKRLTPGAARFSPAIPLARGDVRLP